MNYLNAELLSVFVSPDLQALLPFIVLSLTVVLQLVVIAGRRNHLAVAMITLAGLTGAFCSLPYLGDVLPRKVTPLLVFDNFGLFFLALIFFGGFVVTALSFDYLEGRKDIVEEYYVLLTMATMGAGFIIVSNHFVSFFIGLELLSVSLYTLAAYLPGRTSSLEAGMKYLVTAAVSTSFLLFGIALIYAEYGVMDFPGLGIKLASGKMVHEMWFPAGFALVMVGLGFKLAAAPFHFWTPDVYEGSPAPVTAFIATVSKGAMVAFVLRFFQQVQIMDQPVLFHVVLVIAILSMFTGNLLALLQNNVKRVLAYSSIAHMGYILTAFLIRGSMGLEAVSLYVLVYTFTTLGAFGVITVLSGKDRDFDVLTFYRGLYWRHPILAFLFTTCLLSLAGMPLTAGFIGKFFILTGGVRDHLWVPSLLLVANSALAVFYYLRIIVAMAGPAPAAVKSNQVEEGWSVSGTLVLVALVMLLVWIGVWPSPILDVLHATVGTLGGWVPVAAMIR